MKKKLSMILMLACIPMILAACGSGSTYEIDEELTVEFTGNDEYGRAVIDFDREEVTSAMKEKTKLKNREDKREFNDVIESIEIEAEPNEDLENGDEVDIDLSYDEDNSLNMSFKLKTTKMTVEDLEKMPELSQEDIFSGVDIEYEGVSPFLRAEVIENSSGEVTELFNYSVEDQRYASEDEIEIVAEPHSGLESLEYKVDEKDLTKKIEVPAKETYVEKWDELSEEDEKYILEEIGDTVTAKVDAEIENSTIYDKGDWAVSGRSVTQVDKATKDEQYFLFLKKNQYDKDDQDSYFADDMNNGVRIIYKNKITFDDSTYDDDYDNKTKDYYSVVGASNIILDADGKLDRSELDVEVYGSSDIDKETVKNNELYNIKDKFTMDEFGAKSKD